MSNPLRLRAETAEGISVLSAALQDAIGRVGDMRYDPKTRSFTLRLSRFRHEDERASRIVCGLRIDGVLAAQLRGIDRSDPEGLAVLLALQYKAARPKPSGNLVLVFAGGGEIALDLESIEMILADVSAQRDTDKTPLHPLDGDG